MKDEMACLAIDGGGSTSRFALIARGKSWQLSRGGANVSADFDGAVAELKAGLADLADRSGVDLTDIPTFAGLAGVLTPDMAQRVTAALPLTRLRVTDDRPAAARGALGSADGFLAQCGTGSFFVLQSQGQAHGAGGWGADLGDEASAAWLVRRALAETLKICDGRRAASPLSERLLARFGTPSGIVTGVRTRPTSDIAALAPMVTEAATDPLAKDILKEGAAEIAYAARALGWTPEMPVCLTGGIGPHFAPFLPDDLRACLKAPLASAIDGALALAQDFAAEARP
ncbi:BadF/BadG/BcrA/BcrD ATPase family protein [Pseudaestuariivita sp.]|uniref:BadF/BadG/BcrA/BcrD ATPase family protein n=1 Tax=Pseudaestuariivita sp. TaxID=2211669 RepID=UPI00405A2301